MRRFFALLTIAFFSMAMLWAQDFRSNALGQRLEELGDAECEYVLSVHGNDETLTQNGEVVMTRTTTDEGTGTVTTVTTWPQSGKVRTTVMEEGLLMSETENGRTSTYHYQNGLLMFVQTHDGETFVSVVRYLRDPVDGSLLAVRRFDKTDLVGDSYLFTEDVLYIQPLEDPSVVIEDTFKVLEDGSVMYEEDGTSYVYLPDGLLKTQTSGDEVTTYFYSNRVLERSVTETANSCTISYYDDNAVVMTENWEEGSLVSVCEFSSDGMVKTIYSDAKAVALVTYDVDNRTVLSMTYL